MGDIGPEKETVGTLCALYLEVYRNATAAANLRPTGSIKDRKRFIVETAERARDEAERAVEFVARMARPIILLEENA